MTSIPHLRNLGRVVLKARIIRDVLVVCDLEPKRPVAALCMFNKIRCIPNHALEAALPEDCVPARLTRPVVSVHPRNLDVPRYRTELFNRLFILTCALY